MSAEQKQKCVLTTKQKFALVAWLEKQLPEIQKNIWGKAEVARRATEELGFMVSLHNLSPLIGVDPECMITHRWPRANLSPKDHDELIGRVNLVTKVLAEITRQLNVDLGTIQGEWDILCRELKG